MNNTMDWLKGLPAEIEAVEELIEPQGKVEEDGMEVVGEFTEAEKKLHSLWRKTKKEAELAVIEAKYNQSDEALSVRAIQLNTKADILKKLFWMVLNDGHDLWHSGKMEAIGPGWQVIQYPRKKRGLADIIAELPTPPEG